MYFPGDIPKSQNSSPLHYQWFYPSFNTYWVVFPQIQAGCTNSFCSHGLRSSTPNSQKPSENQLKLAQPSEIINSNKIKEDKVVSSVQNTPSFSKNLQDDNSIADLLPPLKLEQLKQHHSDVTLITEADISDLLNYYIFHPYKYESLLKAIKQRGRREEALIDVFNTEIKRFKKSKEEMIKIIIRRTQKYYKAKHKVSKDQRFRNYGGYKSMNELYLHSIFSDPFFLKSFEDMILIFRQELLRSNQAKVKVMQEHLSTDSCSQNFAGFLSSKNKIPWPASWLKKMHSIIYDLYNIYGDRKSHIIQKLEENINNHSLYSS